MKRTLVFIDSRVRDYEVLIGAYGAEARIVMLEEERDGMEQIVEALEGKETYESIHLVSHGAPGSITVGGTELNSRTLPSYGAELAAIGSALNEGGDLLLYGCNVGRGEKGEAFVGRLAEMTGADVAASDDVTGGTAVGGDWDLEVKSGEVDAGQMVNVVEYDGTLLVVNGGNGNDSLTGTSFDDSIYGFAGNDTLIGYDGNDLLDGGSGDDSMVGGNGDDHFFVDSDADVVEELGGIISDDVVSTTISYSLPGNIEHLVLIGNNDLDGTGNIQDNSITGNDGNNRLNGEGGDDSLYGGAGNDTLNGGTGLGDDLLDGGSGGSDMVDFTSAIASVSVNLMTGLSSGGGGDDTITGIEGVYASDYNDTVVGDDFPNDLWGFAGDDVISGNGGDDMLNGGLGDDTLEGGEGNDVLDGGPGDDSLDGGEGDEDRIDYLDAPSGVTVNLQTGAVTGGAGNDTVTGVEFVLGSDYDDTLEGNELRNSLHGNGGNDVLRGYGGDDILHGESGDDLLDGGEGIDWVNYMDADSGVTINLQTGLASGALGNDTLIGFENVDGSQFDDVLRGDNNANHLNGYDGDDDLRGNAGDDHLEGGSGNDTLEGGAGNDFLEGGAGNDLLGGGAGNDLLEGGSGNDTLEGGAGNDFLEGGAGNDLLGGGAGDDLLEGGAGDDYLDGGTGGNAVNGGEGNDIIVFGGDGGSVDGGEGYDVIVLDRDWWLSSISEHVSNIEGISLQGGQLLIDNTEVSGVQEMTDDDDTLYIFGESDDTVDFENEDGWYATGGTDSITGVGVFDEYTDKDSLVTLYIQTGIDVSYDRYDIVGTSGPDLINGGSDGERIIAFEGNDTVNAGNGNDWVEAYTGDDSVNGEAGDDMLWGGGGNDTINGGDGSDIIGIAGGTALVTGDDTVGGSVDVFAIGEPDGDYDKDSLPLMTITDFNVGQDRIYINILVDELAEGYTGGNPMAADQGYIVLTQDGTDALVQFDVDGTSGEDYGPRTVMILQNVTVSSLSSPNFLNAFYTDASDDDFPASFVYADPGIDPSGGPVAGVTMTGTSDNNSFLGGLGNDTFYGEAGDDYLDGGHGNDELHGGTGNDGLEGGSGDDSLYGEGGDDWIDGGDGVDNVYFSGVAGDYILLDLNSDGSLTFEDTVPGRDGTDTIRNVETFVFAGGTTVGLPYIESFDPVDEAAGIAIDRSIEITFSEDIFFLEGIIALHEDSLNGPVFEICDVTAPGTNLSIDGSVLTIDPTAEFDENTTYYLNISFGALVNDQGNPFILATEYNFKTESPGLIELRPDSSGSVYLESVGGLSDGTIVVTMETDESGLIVDAFNPDGTEDATFSGTFRADEIEEGFELPDGKIFVIGVIDDNAGTGDDLILERYNDDLSFDTTFGGGDGYVTTDLGGDDSPDRVAMQSDGKTLVVVWEEEVTSAVLRYTADGALDTAFSGDGILDIDDPGLDGIETALPQSDNKVVVVTDLVDTSGNWSLCMTRYNESGTADTSYGTDGSFITDLGGTYRIDYETVYMMQDNKILIVGSAEYTGLPDNDIFLARFNADGGLDTSFSDDGIQILDLGGNEQGDKTVLLPDGKILAIGTTDVSGDRDVYGVRFNADGTLDTSFGTGGYVIDGDSGDDEFEEVEVLPDGKILVGAASIGYDGDRDIVLVRYHADGSRDTGFGDIDGVVLEDFGGNEWFEMIVQEDGKIVVGVESIDTFDDSSDLFLVRYNADGTRDLTFGSANVNSGPMMRNGEAVEAEEYTGPATGAGGEPLDYQYIGDSADEVLIGTGSNDFINVTGGTDAVDAGAGNDVIDGGTGSNFLTGGEGTDIFFVDGRGGQTTWSTITDWEEGEQLSVWGWTPGTSQILFWMQAGAPGYEGLTMHADLNGDAVIDTSVTFTGIVSQSELPAPLEFDGLLWFV